MLEQKHNKRAAISQASSSINPNCLSPVIWAPSNPLQWTNLGTSEVPQERKQQPTSPRRDQSWPAHVTANESLGKGKNDGSWMEMSETNWHFILSWRTKIDCDYRWLWDVRKSLTTEDSVPRPGFASPFCCLSPLPIPYVPQRIASVLTGAYRMWGMPTPPWRIL